MELGQAINYILTPKGETILGEKYLYREDHCLWFIVTLLSRKESDEKVEFEAIIEDILWRKNRYDIGDTFTFGCTKNFYYPIWWLSTLKDGLQRFMDNIPDLSKVKELHPNIDFEKEVDVIRLVKIAHDVEIIGDNRSDS